MASGDRQRRKPPSQAQEVSQAATWGSMLNDYCEHGRAQPAPAIERQFRYTRKNGGEVKEQQRRFDPITQRHRNPDKEQAVVVKEEAQSVKDVNKGMKKALLQDSYVGYNIVNQAPKFGLKDVSTMGVTDGKSGKRTGEVIPHKAPVNYDIINLQQFAPDPVVPKNPKSTRLATRQYNIVNHIHRAGNDKLRQTERDAAVAHYNNTRSSYDLLRARHVSDDTERRLDAQDATLRQRKREELHATTNKTPAAIKRSEGHNYDIIQGKVYSKSGTASVEKHAHLGVTHRQVSRQHAAKHVADVDGKDTMNQKKAVNRMAHERNLDRCRSGHDIITGASLPSIHKGRNAQAARETPWDTLNRTAQQAQAQHA
eukprot:TRINITY_DN10882_c1_g1_i2.p2 TRINITY_DN10882_c1_g1~~TRINITY_DN10882_c1_g1_i2.p2  ORF type:complete len:369 (+),score=128.90 TRINITY_DN10882_c1_g1_i2:90-1196(+)